MKARFLHHLDHRLPTSVWQRFPQEHSPAGGFALVFHSVFPFEEERGERKKQKVGKKRGEKETTQKKMKRGVREGNKREKGKEEKRKLHK